ncbi:MAG TPA: hypothetical protein VK766_12395 [Cytophagaceae bacterium]|jgi:hypothetical protein|nr:hypothetical protein [Cytophagaceae bacterium]
MEEKNSTTANIEKNIILQVLTVSLFGISIYIFKSLFIIKSEEVLVQSIGAFVLYSGLIIMVYLPGNFLLKKRITTLVLFLSIIGSFFELGGLRGITCLDVINLVLYTSIIYRGQERNYYFGLFFITLFGLVYLQITTPSLFTNRSASDPDWMLALNIIIRMALSFNIGIALREAYSKEHEITNELLLKINNLNNEILAQNEELKSIQEDLKINNMKLEKLVHERTAKLEVQNETLITYAYLNSHIFRGPVCRLMGLLQLMKIEKNGEEKIILENYLYAEVESIDIVVKDISKILYENDQELMDEIKNKVKKLYQHT